MDEDNNDNNNEETKKHEDEIDKNTDPNYQDNNNHIVIKVKRNNSNNDYNLNPYAENHTINENYMVGNSNYDNYNMENMNLHLNNNVSNRPINNIHKSNSQGLNVKKIIQDQIEKIDNKEKKEDINQGIKIQRNNSSMNNEDLNMHKHSNSYNNENLQLNPGEEGNKYIMDSNIKGLELRESPSKKINQHKKTESINKSNKIRIEDMN